ncbi:MAG: hypothetical protein WBP54_10295 [Pelodictyon phaeoclathratiforme]
MTKYKKILKIEFSGTETDDDRAHDVIYLIYRAFEVLIQNFAHKMSTNAMIMYHYSVFEEEEK